MAEKNLVIVESPTKARTISKIMGSNFTVLPSMGHVIDLPAKKLGVDIEGGFVPTYKILAARKKLLAQLKKEAKGAANIYMATDPDREGEAIGWNIVEAVFKDKPVKRVIFHEITAEAIRHAFESPREFDQKMVEAQVTRRILDRIVGYLLSPLLWKKITRGLSAGRVQSVALRLIIDRERAILVFKPQEYWEIEAELRKDNVVFTAKLDKKDSNKVEIKNQQEAGSIVAELKDKRFEVLEVKKTEKKRFPDPPFITSTLQQEAFNKLRYNATKTMIIAQQLYEGIDIGEEAPMGLITYMRTDSVNIAAEAVSQARDLILKKFGNDYLPEKPPVYKTKKFAQQAHEAIRPTLISRSPDSLKEYLTDEQYKLFELIYNRFIASQMMPARYLQTSVSIQAGEYIFSASGSTLLFKGFSALYEKLEEEKEKKEIPPLEKGQILELIKLVPSQHFTKPPPRFSDSSIVKVLEEEGIGRPSTYAPIIATLIQRGYVNRIKGYLNPTELGFKVCDMLLEYFPNILDVKFTAQMEEELDGVEEGRTDRLKVLTDFYGPFKISYDYAFENIKKE
ncbi:MAG: type I DNA topoisomerase, partial [Candidatus Omnitrophota bacterium]